MKLRSQIFLFLLVLGLAPLLTSVIINVPLVFDRLELFYHKAYLEKLRTDFRDLDQHISRRHEMVRLFAKLAEPGIALAGDNEATDDEIAQSRIAYTDWANRVLFDQLDVTQVMFIDKNGVVSFSLDRDSDTGILTSDGHSPDVPDIAFLSAGMKLKPGNVLTSPISFNQDVDEADRNRFMTLRFISPVISASRQGGPPELQGSVVFNLDVGGLAHVYDGIYWVLNDGNYLSYQEDVPGSTAFMDFPGLEEIFDKGELALWKHDDRQIFWLPLFVTQDSGLLWVGRSVDPSPIAEFRHTLEVRVFVIVTGLLLVVFVVARIISVRMERISQELTEGITQVLEKDEPVRFSWRRPEELRMLGNNFTRLAEKHAHDTRVLRSHTRELEESNRYKSEFLANVSHELRTPLNSILLLSKMLANSTDDIPGEHIDQARVIHDAGKDLRALIDTILDLSRIEAGKASLNTEHIELQSMLNDLCDLMRPQFDEKNLELELLFDPETPATLETDGEKLRQILLNFLSNALKFTDKGKVTLQVSQNTGDDLQARPVAISVRDSGIGIPAEKHALVFEAFKQADGSTSRRYGGTGLGLTISRELANLIGGHIDIESREGSGSTFTLSLPLVIEEITADSSSRADTTPEHGRTSVQLLEIPEAHYPGSRILVVDDDLRNLLAITPLLEGWDIEVVAAGDGHEALENLNEDDTFDVILMDLMMPEMDGYETIGKIRSRPEWKSLPVVALTAKAAGEDRDKAIASGADNFLAKPVNPDDLKLILDQYLVKTLNTGKNDAERTEGQA